VNHGIAAILAIRSNVEEFLCTSDCMAERDGFEASVRFCRGKPRQIARLQISKLAREFHTKGRTKAVKAVLFLFALHSVRHGDDQAILYHKLVTRAAQHCD
jgi:hypothetical protein